MRVHRSRRSATGASRGAVSLMKRSSAATTAAASCGEAAGAISSSWGRRLTISDPQCRHPMGVWPLPVRLVSSSDGVGLPLPNEAGSPQAGWMARALVGSLACPRCSTASLPRPRCRSVRVCVCWSRSVGVPAGSRCSGVSHPLTSSPSRSSGWSATKIQPSPARSAGTPRPSSRVGVPCVVPRDDREAPRSRREVGPCAALGGGWWASRISR